MWWLITLETTDIQAVFIRVVQGNTLNTVFVSHLKVLKIILLHSIIVSSTAQIPGERAGLPPLPGNGQNWPWCWVGQPRLGLDSM